MSFYSSLTNHFLIAMPALADPNFSHTVTYMCEHNTEGAMGVIINRPTELTLIDIADQMDIEVNDDELAQVPVYQGGPVQLERGFVLHSPLGEWDNSMEITPELALTMSQDIIEAIANGMGPEKYLITLGYAGWGENQLEDELGANAWLNGPAQSSIIFNTASENRWTAAAALLGVDLNNLSNDVGHA